MKENRDYFNNRRLPEKNLLDEIVKRTVESVNPLRIILFGSAASGTMGPDSDIDLLVIMPEGVHRRRTAQTIYKSLRGMGISKDIIVVTQTDIEKYGDNQSLIIYPALKHGKELYHAAG